MHVGLRSADWGLYAIKRHFSHIATTQIIPEIEVARPELEPRILSPTTTAALHTNISTSSLLTIFLHTRWRRNICFDLINDKLTFWSTPSFGHLGRPYDLECLVDAVLNYYFCRLNIVFGYIHLYHPVWLRCQSGVWLFRFVVFFFLRINLLLVSGLCWLVGWLVGCIEDLHRAFAVFHPYRDLEAGDTLSLKIQLTRPGIEPRSSCSACQELNHSATTAPLWSLLGRFFT